jgi:hypothetical protein
MKLSYVADILNSELDSAGFVIDSNIKRDLAVGRRKFDGVAQQVHQHLFEAFGIGRNLGHRASLFVMSAGARLI